MIYCSVQTWGFLEKSTLVWRLREFSSVCENHAIVQIFLVYSWGILLQISIPFYNTNLYLYCLLQICLCFQIHEAIWNQLRQHFLKIQILELVLLCLTFPLLESQMTYSTARVLVKTMLFSFLCLGQWPITFFHCEVPILNTHKKLYELVFYFIDWRESISSIKLP